MQTYDQNTLLTSANFIHDYTNVYFIHVYGNTVVLIHTVLQKQF